MIVSCNYWINMYDSFLNISEIFVVVMQMMQTITCGKTFLPSLCASNIKRSGTSRKAIHMASYMDRVVEDAIGYIVLA